MQGRATRAGGAPTAGGCASKASTAGARPRTPEQNHAFE